MAVSELHIPATNNTPEILLIPNGFIRMDGRGLTGLNIEISEKILFWINEYLNDPQEITEIIVALEYLNSASAKILVAILREISKVKEKSCQLFVHWCYEDEDEDIRERGEFISQSLSIPIDFIRCKNIKHCCRSIC